MKSYLTMHIKQRLESAELDSSKPRKIGWLD